MSISESKTSAGPRSGIPERREQKLPLLALLALATAVFLTSLTETLPAGLLPDMGSDLNVSESATGQTVTVYAIGTALTAIPLTAATAGCHRKRILLVAMAGIPVALSLGVPAGTFPSRATSWQAAFLTMTGLTVLLLVFGAASLLSIWIVGAQINRRLRGLMIGATLLMAVAAVLLAVLSDSQPMVYAAVVLWALGWGGAPTLLQTAAGDAGGEQADAVQAMPATLWNVAMAAGGILGGVLLGLVGSGSFPWTVLVLLVPALIVGLAARAHGFPAKRAADAA